MAADNKLELVIEVDANRANASIKSVNAGLSSIEQTVAKTARGTSAGIDDITVSMVKGAGAVAWSGVSSKPAWNSDPATFIGGAWHLAWKNYGTNHVIFDASQSTAPNGAAVNNTNAGTAWAASYPTLMGWNGSSTYGVRVDSARVADGVAWTGVSGRPTALSQFTNDSGFQTSGGSVNYATSAGGVAWSGVSSKPAAAANITGNGWIRAYDVGCGNSYNATSCDAGGDGYIDYTNSSGWATSAGNADTVDAYHSSNIANAYTHQGSFAWVDPYIALPTGLVMYGVFTPQANQATITKVWCWSDDNSSVIQLRWSDGGDMLPGNMACGTGGVTRTDFNGYQVIPVGYSVGIWQVSGAAKQIRVGFTYTTAY